MQDNKIMRPRFKWFVALLLVCAMMVAFIPSLAGLNFTPDPLAPDLKIVSTLTDGGKYLEVGLNVDSKDGTFQSAGVLLSYDPAMLTPIIWGEVTQEDGTAIDGAVLSPGQATSAESAWSDAIVLPTKGADELSGKLAKAVEWEGTGYLYISAEAAETMEKLNQELPTTTEEEPETELPQPTPGTDEPATQEDTGDTTEPTDPETPATPERQSATASGMTISYIDEATAPTEQATIVRFRVNEKLAAATEGAEATLYTLEELAPSLDVVVYDKNTDNQTAKAVLDNSLLALDPTADKYAGVTYIADNSDYNTAGFDKPANLEFVWIANGVSVNTGTGTGGSSGPSSTEGIIAVTVFDWDGTMMGTFTYYADEDPTVQQANADAAIAEFKARESVAATLVSHKGYDFLDFVKDEDSIPTSYGTRVDSVANTTLAELTLQEDDAVDFSTLTESTTAKAAYTTNAECVTGDGLGAADAVNARRYTTSIDSYDRFGTGQSFSVKIKVERGSVPRSTEGALRVRLQIDGVSVYSQYELTGADVEIVEVAPYAQSSASAGLTGVELLEWTIIDTYGTSNWVGAAARTTVTECQSTASFEVTQVGTTKNVAVWDEGTYPFYGVIAGLNTALESYHQLKLENPDLAPSNSNMSGVSLPILRSIGIPPLGLANARKAVYDAYVANGAQPLDYVKLYEAASGTTYVAETN